MFNLEFHERLQAAGIRPTFVNACKFFLRGQAAILLVVNLLFLIADHFDLSNPVLCVRLGQIALTYAVVPSFYLYFDTLLKPARSLDYVKMLLVNWFIVNPFWFVGVALYNVVLVVMIPFLLLGLCFVPCMSESMEERVFSVCDWF